MANPRHRIEYENEGRLDSFTTPLGIGWLDGWAHRNVRGRFEISDERDGGKVICNQDGVVADPEPVLAYEHGLVRDTRGARVERTAAQPATC